MAKDELTSVDEAQLLRSIGEAVTAAVKELVLPSWKPVICLLSVVPPVKCEEAVSVQIRQRTWVKQLLRQPPPF